MFINLNFEMTFDNFTRATCILYIDLVKGKVIPITGLCGLEGG